jgi:hypothetical protein
MPYVCKETGLRIIGVNEKVPVAYPITKDPHNPDSWSFSGEEAREWWDASERILEFNPRTGEEEETFTRSDGEDVFWDQIEWRDE